MGYECWPAPSVCSAQRLKCYLSRDEIPHFMSTASVVVVFRSAFDLNQALGLLQITDVKRGLELIEIKVILDGLSSMGQCFESR